MAAFLRSRRRSDQRRRFGIVAVTLIVALALSASGVPRSDVRVLVPVGRSSVVGPNRYEATIDDERWTGAVVADAHGGYWLRVDPIPADGATFVLRVTVAAPPTPSLDPGPAVHDWLAPGVLIDSTHPAIIAAGRAIATGEVSAADKTAAIHEYLASTLSWRRYPQHQGHPASATLALGYGTCGGFARLFVALSRAVGVPARTVRGVIFDRVGREAHHQWAEFRDESDVWHMVDPTTAPDYDTSSRTYLDLVYAAEENPFWSEPNFVIAYDATPNDGQLGYRVTGTTGAIRTVENTYTLVPIGHTTP